MNTSKQVNEYLVRNFPKAEDAFLVEQHVGQELYNLAIQFLLKGKEQDLLAWLREQRVDEQEASLRTTN